MFYYLYKCNLKYMEKYDFSVGTQLGPPNSKTDTGCIQLHYLQLGKLTILYQVIGMQDLYPTSARTEIQNAYIVRKAEQVMANILLHKAKPMHLELCDSLKEEETVCF